VYAAGIPVPHRRFADRERADVAIEDKFSLFTCPPPTTIRFSEVVQGRVDETVVGVIQLKDFHNSSLLRRGSLHSPLAGRTLLLVQIRASRALPGVNVIIDIRRNYYLQGRLPRPTPCRKSTWCISFKGTAISLCQTRKVAAQNAQGISQ
jgi:hypothetical protein